MLRIPSRARTYVFDPHQPAVADADLGQTIVFETLDCFDGQVRSETDLATSIDMTHINPNTGPVRIRAATPGKILAVRIVAIKLRGPAVAALIPGAGILKDLVPGPRTKICPIAEDGAIDFGEGLAVAPRPMVGTLGTTPAAATPTGLPGNHGGNMDVPMVTAGSTVYLPIYVQGALFQLGDVHAAMGDGESSVTGMECGADVVVEFTGIHRARAALGPLIETPEAWGVVGSAPTLEQAVRVATRRAADFLVERLGIDAEEAAILISTACDARIGQWADANYDAVAYVQIPKALDCKGRLATY